MAWLRALGLVAVVAVLAGWSSSAHVTGPLVRDQWNADGGWPLVGEGPTGIGVRFVERTLFAIDISFKNTSQQPVTVTTAQAVLPSRSILSQVGTRLLNWDPTPCPPKIIGCVTQSFFREASASDRAEPVTVQPGKGLGVQLDFRVGSCSAVPFASFAPVSAVALSYGGGGQQSFALAGSTLRLVRPPSTVCVARPFSRLAVDGAFADSTASTIPLRTEGPCARTRIGSFQCLDDDRCSVASGRVTFRSGLFLSGDRPMQRIRIRLRGYRGSGRYVVNRDADVLDVVGIGSPGWTTYRAFAGSVTVDRVTAGTLEGHVRATLTGFRKKPFHAFGTWACTLG